MTKQCRLLVSCQIFVRKSHRATTQLLSPGGHCSAPAIPSGFPNARQPTFHASFFAAAAVRFSDAIPLALARITDSLAIGTRRRNLSEGRRASSAGAPCPLGAVSSAFISIVKIASELIQRAAL